jgi:hypothetical protein
MPDEAFGWLLIAITQRIWPDGLGGFKDDSRKAITSAKAEATKLIDIISS